MKLAIPEMQQITAIAQTPTEETRVMRARPILLKQMSGTLGLVSNNYFRVS